MDFRRGLGAFFHGGGYEGNKVSKSQDLRYFLSMKCRWVVYAANSYHRVVDLPFGEMRGFEATIQTLVLESGADVEVVRDE